MDVKWRSLKFIDIILNYICFAFQLNVGETEAGANEVNNQVSVQTSGYEICEKVVPRNEMKDGSSQNEYPEMFDFGIGLNIIEVLKKGQRKIYYFWTFSCWLRSNQTKPVLGYLKAS